MSTLTVGLLADTHIPHRLARLPEAVFDALAGVDVILHAGDVDDPAALEPLRATAPIHAVRGNFHVMDLSDAGASLPAVVKLQLAGLDVVLTHGHRPGPIGFGLKGLHVIARWMRLTDNGALNHRNARRLARLYPTADVIVFGHSHKAHVEWVENTLLINPGAVTGAGEEDPPSIARMHLGAGKPGVEIITLPAQRHTMRNTHYTTLFLNRPAWVFERRYRCRTHGGER